MQPKFFELAPIIKAVLFHFQILVYGCIYGIKCNIAKKKTVLLISKKGTTSVSFWDGLSKIDHHLPKTSKRHICPKPWKVQVFQKAMSLLWATKISPWFVLHRNFPCSMPALQNLTHQPKALFTSQGSQEVLKLLPRWRSFTFRPRYQI